MKHLSAFLFLLFIAAGAYAQQGVVTGIITGRDGKPVQFTNIAIPALHAGATADQQGRFTIRGVPPGNYEIRISMVGYRPVKIRKTIGGEQSTALVISLEAELSKLE